MVAPLYFRMLHEQLDEAVSWTSDDTSAMDQHFRTQNASTTQLSPIVSQPFCQMILVQPVGTSLVRIWDLAMLIPNLAFFLFLLIIFRKAISQLHRTNSPIFTSFFVLICVANLLSILRCAISILLKYTKDSDTADRIMWIILRFFLLATELSVVTFGLLFGHLDSRTSIQRVLLVTFLISLIYSGTQGTLEFVYVNEQFHNISHCDNYYTLFGHGGMIFWFVSSACLFLIYGAMFILPFLRIQQRVTLPTKRSFFWYCFVLACLNVVQAVGAALLYFRVQPGMCLVNFMAYLYFTGFVPLVYAIFLHQFLSSGSSTSSLRFSYKLQVDDDDELNLPHHAINYDSQDESGVGGGADVSGVVDSTHFSSNPLYAGLITRPELPFVRDHFTRGKQKPGELQNVTA